MAETVVKIDNLVKRYKELIALDHFDLEIKKGERFGQDHHDKLPALTVGIR